MSLLLLLARLMSLAAHRESFGKKANQPPPPKGLNQSYNDTGTFALRLNGSFCELPF